MSRFSYKRQIAKLITFKHQFNAVKATCWKLFLHENHKDDKIIIKIEKYSCKNMVV
jgi:hypothetical protein